MSRKVTMSDVNAINESLELFNEELSNLNLIDIKEVKKAFAFF